MLSDRRILVTSIIIILICYFAIFYSGVKIIHSSVSRPDDQNIEPNIRLMSDYIAPHLHGDEVGAIEIHKKYSFKGSGEIEKLEAEIRKIPRFRKPKHNALTRSQVEKFNGVCMVCIKEAREAGQKHFSSPPGFFKVLALYFNLPMMFNLCRNRGLVEHSMTEEEFDWVREQLFKAALFSINRKFATKTVSDAELPVMTRAQQSICRNLGLLEDKEGYTDYYPERLNIKEIPRCNVELFLEMKDQVRWTYVNFSSVNFDNQDIVRAAQALPACPP